MSMVYGSCTAFEQVYTETSTLLKRLEWLMKNWRMLEDADGLMKQY